MSYRADLLCNFVSMTRTVRFECDDPKRVELLLKVAKEMGIEVLPEDGAYGSVQEPELSYEQKKVLDERRSSSKEEDFIPWDKAKKKLKFGKE